MTKKIFIILFLVLPGCAKKEYQNNDLYNRGKNQNIYQNLQSMGQNSEGKSVQVNPPSNQFDAYEAQVNALSIQNLLRQQERLSNESRKALLEYNIIYQKEETKREAIRSTKTQKQKKRVEKKKYLLPKICTEERNCSDCEYNPERDEICAEMEKVYKSLEEEYGEPESIEEYEPSAIIINAQGASDFAINVQSHGNTNQGRKKIQPEEKKYVKSLPKFIFPSVPKPQKGVMQSFFDNLFGTVDNAFNKTADLANNNSGIIGLSIVGSELAKKSTTQVGGNQVGGNDNAGRNDWEYNYKYTGVPIEE